MSEYEPEVNEVEVPVLNRDLCNAWLENRELNVTDGMICAGYKEGGKDACQVSEHGPFHLDTCTVKKTKQNIRKCPRDLDRDGEGGFYK
jgi:hypothetical protein